MAEDIKTSSVKSLASAGNASLVIIRSSSKKYLPLDTSFTGRHSTLPELQEQHVRRNVKSFGNR